LYASTNGSATFAAATTGLAGTGRASAVFGKEGEVWIAAGANLYHSKNSGANATKVAGVTQVYSVGFGKAAPNAAYPAVYIVGTVNTVAGVFRSIDEGATWVRVNDDQHQYGQIDNCAGDEDHYGRVYVTTQGRGIPYGEPASQSEIVHSSLRGMHASANLLKKTGNRIVAEGCGVLELLDVRGCVVRHGVQRDGSREINLSGLRKGVYIARSSGAVLRVVNDN
jgi:hypothetical protein